MNGLLRGALAFWALSLSLDIQPDAAAFQLFMGFLPTFQPLDS